MKFFFFSSSSFTNVHGTVIKRIKFFTPNEKDKDELLSNKERKVQPNLYRPSRRQRF